MAELQPETSDVRSIRNDPRGEQAGTYVSQFNPPRTDSHWYAVTVCPRHEKKVMGQLEGRGVRCFVPMFRSVRRWKDRRKELDLALFPGYAFVQIELGRRLSVLTVPGVVRSSRSADNPLRWMNARSVRSTPASPREFPCCLTLTFKRAAGCAWCADPWPVLRAF